MLQTLEIPKSNQAISSNEKNELIPISDYEKGKVAAVQKAAERLKAKYRIDFNQTVLPFRKRIGGTVVFHKFDLVSSDNQIVAKVKTHTMNPSGNIPSAKILDTYVACEMLENVAAKTKMLILTDFAFYKSFKNNTNGRISRQIKIVCTADKQLPVLTHC